MRQLVSQRQKLSAHVSLNPGSSWWAALGRERPSDLSTNQQRRILTLLMEALAMRLFADVSPADQHLAATADHTTADHTYG